MLEFEFKTIDTIYTGLLTGICKYIYLWSRLTLYKRVFSVSIQWPRRIRNWTSTNSKSRFLFLIFRTSVDATLAKTEKRDKSLHWNVDLHKKKYTEKWHLFSKFSVKLRLVLHVQDRFANKLEMLKQMTKKYLKPYPAISISSTIPGKIWRSAVSLFKKATRKAAKISSKNLSLKSALSGYVDKAQDKFSTGGKI